VEADKLLGAGFIEEAQYTTWLSNIVLVKKANGKWRMCVDYTGDIRQDCDAGGGAYRLEQLSREEIPNTWNISHLKFYFS